MFVVGKIYYQGLDLYKFTGVTVNRYGVPLQKNYSLNLIDDL